MEDCCRRRPRTGIPGSERPDQGGVRGPRSSPYRLRWANLYRSGRAVYVPPPAPRAAVGQSLRRSSQRAGLGRREGGRGIPRKSRGVYAVITDFSLQYQRSEKPGTELGTACRRRCRTPMPLAGRGRAHTRKLDRPAVWEAARSALAPVPASWAAAARERPRSGACHGASRPLRRLSRVAALRDAGAWAVRDAAMAYTRARSTRPMRM